MKDKGPRNWWGFGLLAMTLGIGGIVNLLGDDDPQVSGGYVGGLLIALGLFLLVASAVAHGSEARQPSRDS